MTVLSHLYHKHNAPIFNEVFKSSICEQLGLVNFSNELARLGGHQFVLINFFFVYTSVFDVNSQQPFLPYLWLVTCACYDIHMGNMRTAIMKLDFQVN